MNGSLSLAEHPPDQVVEQTIANGDAVLKLGLYLLLFTGQREGDVVRMKWEDIRKYDGRDEIQVNQEKTGAKIWVPLHRDLKTLLDATPHASDFILNSTWGRPFASSQSLYEKIKIVLKKTGNVDFVPHGLRATAAVRLIEAGCSEDQAAAITGHRDMNVLRGYLRGVNQAKLARQAISKQEAAG
jgi:integrase